MPILYLREEDLLEGLKDGEDEAFEALLNLYGDKTLRVCFLILKDMACAEDAVQEVFIQVYKSIAKFKGHSSLYTWIYKIAVNKCRDILKRRNESYCIDDVDTTSDIDVEYEVLGNVDREKIRDLIFALPCIYREVITLFYMEDAPIKDICTILGESEGTVKSRLFRARSILKQALLKEGISCE